MDFFFSSYEHALSAHSSSLLIDHSEWIQTFWIFMEGQLSCSIAANSFIHVKNAIEHNLILLYKSTFTSHKHMAKIIVKRLIPG